MKNIPSFHEDDFKQSSFCTIPGHCVQVAYKSGIIAVRDSKNPQQNLPKPGLNESFRLRLRMNC